MERGLDELVEWLLVEIGFSGSQGMWWLDPVLIQLYRTCYTSPSTDQRDALPGFGALDLVKAVKAFYTAGPGSGTGSREALPSSEAIKSQEVDDADISHASIVWKWLCARSDVIIGDGKTFNGICLQEALDFRDKGDISVAAAASEEPSQQSLSAHETPGSTRKGTSSYSQKSSGRAGKASGSTARVAPRLHLTEELQWKAISGHKPDLKRIPQFEWQALVAIASVKEAGILQGDLVRLTGQDKRSLPTRTDALAKKGYVVKQPVMLRGCRTSKIWLAQFAHSAKEESNREGLDFEKLDLRRETLVKNWDPVPFSNYWNGDRLDHIALAQGFLAIVKAFSKIRYCDVRLKLDINGLVPQMRALQKSSRWFAGRGIIQFKPMKAPDSNRMFRDCVVFIREPTLEEWSSFRKTPSTRLKDPSTRPRGKGKKSRAGVHKAPSKPPQDSKAEKMTKNAQMARLPSPDMIKLSEWDPYKPLMNTVFEVIKRAGAEGTSNWMIGFFLLGWPYRKWIFSMTTLLGQTRVQLPHLKPFSVTSRLNRRGKTMTYNFYATSIVDPEKARSAMMLESDEPDSEAEPRESISPSTKYGFPQPASKLFARKPPASNTTTPRKPLIRKRRPSPESESPKPFKRRGRPPKVSEPAPPEMVSAAADEIPNEDTEPPAETPGRRFRARRKPIAHEPPNEPENSTTEEPESPRSNEATKRTEQEDIQTPTQGVFYGEPNSLDPRPTRGRKRKSLVVIIRLPSLKKTDCAVNAQTPKQDSGQAADSSNAPQTATPNRNQRRPARGSKTYKCEKCGNTWKNDNGLEYHQKKSQTPCNPDWVPPPLKPISVPSRRSQPKIASSAVATPVQRPRRPVSRVSEPALGVSSQTELPSRRPRLAASLETPQIAPASKGATSHHRSILLNPGPVQNVSDLSPSGSFTSPLVGAAYLSHRPYAPSLTTSHMTPTDPQSTDKSPYVAETDATQDPGPRRTPIRQDSGSEISPPASATNQSFGMETAVGGTPVYDNDITVTTPANQTRKTNRAGKTTVKSEGALRRERVARILRDLLQRNGGALPGDRALHILISKAWNDEPTDFASPDLKSCTSIVNKMLEAKTIRKDHFGFYDPNGKMGTISVISQGENCTSNTGPAAASVAEKILQVKAKAMELYPATYIPPLFSGADAKPDLSISIDHTSSTSGLSIEVEPNARKDVLTLDYNMPPVLPPDTKSKQGTPHMAEIVSGTSRSKRPRKQSVDSGVTLLASPKDAKRRKASDVSGPTVRGAPSKKNRTGEDAPSFPASNLENAETGTGNPMDHSASDDDALVFIAMSQKTKARASTNGLASSRGVRGSGRGRGRGRGRARGRGAMADDDRHPIKTTTDDHNIDDPDTVWVHDSDLPTVEHALEISASRVLEPQMAAPSEILRSDSDDEVDAYLNMIPDQSSNHEFEPESAQSPEKSKWCTAFAPIRSIRALDNGAWPHGFPRTYFMDNPGESFTMAGPFPSPQWLLTQNLPQSTDDILSVVEQKTKPFRSSRSSCYREFLRRLKAIESWELSEEGVYLQFVGSIVPGHIYLSLDTGPALSSTQEPPELEWSMDRLYTADNLPRDIIDAPSDADVVVSPQSEQILSESIELAEAATPVSEPQSDGEDEDMPARKRRKRRRSAPVTIRRDLVFTTRILSQIPPQSRGRWNKRRAEADVVGLDGEHDLLVAFLVLKCMVGGVEKLIDWGVLLKLFPQMSLSGLRRFWSRVHKERKGFVIAFNNKFQSAFLEAYQKGEVPRLDYDDLENYDWKTLITWAAKLETHERVDLPATRGVLEQRSTLQEPNEREGNWRDEWFGPLTSVHARIDAAAGEPLAFSIGCTQAEDREMKLATSWIKSLCNNSSRSTVGEDIRDALYKLGKRDEKSLNALLEQAVTKLMADKVISKVKGKYMAQVFKINNNFEKRAQKLANVDKFLEAVAFKTELDECFRAGQEVKLPYDANAGTVLATLNMQAYGRIRLEDVDFRHVPFGFEPSNYEGRLFPKSYYQFGVRLVPTETYVYSDNLPVLEWARELPAPKVGPMGEIPIWRDFFGNVDSERWVQFLCLVVFMLATRGPLSAKSATALLHPMLEEFEVELIAQWIEKLGILERVVQDRGWTVGEWWWLVIGNVINPKGKRKVEV